MATAQQGRCYRTRNGNIIGPLVYRKGDLAFGRYRYTPAGNCFVQFLGGSEVPKPELDIMFDPPEGFAPETIAVMPPGDDTAIDLNRDLIAADLLAVLSDLRRESVVDEENSNLSRSEADDLYRRADVAITNAIAAGINGRSFADRERELLAANNRYLEEARAARREFADLLVRHQEMTQTFVGNLISLGQKARQRRDMLKAILPYAESRAEDMLETAEEAEDRAKLSPNGRPLGSDKSTAQSAVDARAAADKAAAAVDDAKRLLGII